MGCKLANPPYLQVALDMTDCKKAKSIVSRLPESRHILIEAGTPLIKSFGAKAVCELRKSGPKFFYIADLKTLDTGKIEAGIASEAKADAAIVSGLAQIETIEAFIGEAGKRGMCSIVDFMNVPDPVSVLRSLKKLPQIASLHRGIDAEESRGHSFDTIEEIKTHYPKVLVSVAGGITLETAKPAIQSGADIVVVGRAITQAKNPGKAAGLFLERMGV